MLMVVCTAICTSPLVAQTMRFSVYTDWSVGTDGNTLYSGQSVIDQSTCYLHSNYLTNAIIYAPDGRQASAQSSGLYANTSIALNGVTGNFSLVGSGSFYCGCAFVVSGFGGGMSLGIDFAVTYSAKAASVTDADGYCPQVDNCSPWCIPRCSVSKIRESFGGGHPCDTFHESLVAIANGSCTYGVSIPAAGPGPCTQK